MVCGQHAQAPTALLGTVGADCRLTFVLAIPVFAMLGIGERSAIVPNVMPMSMLLFIS
jgi:hypothetical protein